MNAEQAIPELWNSHRALAQRVEELEAHTQGDINAALIEAEMLITELLDEVERWAQAPHTVDAIKRLLGVLNRQRPQVIPDPWEPHL